MFCKWCGMESETSDVCSWCRKPFSTTATPSASETAPPPQSAPAPTTTPEPHAPPAASPARQSPSAGSPIMLGDSLDDDLDDDFSPLPFAGPVRPPAPETPQRTVPPPVPPGPVTAPPAAPRPAAPPAYTPPPVSPGRGGPGYTPAQARQPEDGRQLEAIPIKRPSVIPIARPPQPRQEPPATPPPSAPPAATQPPAPAPLPLRQPTTPPPAPPLAHGPIPLGEAPTREAAAPPPERPIELDLPPLATEEPEAEEMPPLATPPGRRLDLGGAPAAPQAHSLPAHIMPPRSAVPRAGGRTWYCRWCGMESETADTCSWCHKDLRNLPASQGRGPHVTVTHAPPTNRRGPARPAAPPKQPAPAPRPAENKPVATAEPPPAPAHTPQIGTFQAQKSKYYSDKVLDPVSGMHYDADSGTAEAREIETVEDLAVNERAELLRQIAIWAGSLVVIIGLMAALGSAARNLYLLWLGVGSFAACILMPVIGVAPFAEDDSEDIALAIGLILILGPFVGGLLYGIICVMKQGWNPAIAGVFLSYVLVRVGVDLATGHDAISLFSQMLPALSDWQSFAARWMPLAGIAGWYSASVFHKTDE